MPLCPFSGVAVFYFVLKIETTARISIPDLHSLLQKTSGLLAVKISNDPLDV